MSAVVELGSFGAMITLRLRTVCLLVVFFLSVNAAVFLPAFHDSKAAHDLRRTAFDAPAEQASELRARARAVNRAESHRIFSIGAIVAVVSGVLLGWRIHRCGGFSSALWRVDPAPPPKL
ncbi:MAG: hypothetical protein RIS76_4430 [Verrucomicrobiota bacterium]